VPHPSAPDFDQAPFLLIWEATRSCALACVHCRAEAIDKRDPLELSTEEGKTLLKQTADMGTPIVVLTGGDPLQRDDLEELVEAGCSYGLRMATIPAATERLTRERLASLKAAGISQIALSLDAPTAKPHDEFRGVEGSFDRTIAGARMVRELDIPLQINTVLGPWNAHLVADMAAWVKELGVSFWEVFFLVPVGRGQAIDRLDGQRVERLFEELYDIARGVDFVVKIAEAQHYRRFVTMRLLQQHGSGQQTGAEVSRLLERKAGPRRGMGQSPRAVNSGRGFCFVDHRGDVQPSGFLPLTAGNVREADIADIYRNSELFRSLRDPSKLTGRCGRCEFAELCGGSRSRAWAITGNLFATDPWCAYEPGQIAREDLVALEPRTHRPGARR
jgi:AdoMet-dependent heme synthase